MFWRSKKKEFYENVRNNILSFGFGNITAESAGTPWASLVEQSRLEGYNSHESALFVLSTRIASLASSNKNLAKNRYQQSRGVVGNWVESQIIRKEIADHFERFLQPLIFNLDNNGKRVVVCTSCSAKLSIPSGKSGNVRCPKCNNTFAVTSGGY